MSAGSNRIYFPNLDAIRFLAAGMVFLNHIEWTKVVGGVRNFNGLPFTYNNGVQGVNLFFTLSGFLITYLLLAEQKQTGAINVAKFYIRRVLRIWPVYYLTVATAFFLLPRFVSVPTLEFPVNDHDYWTKLALFLCLLPNVAYVAYPIVPFASQLWTVGVEEQFYLIWPLLGRFFRKVFFWVLVSIVTLSVATRLMVDHYYAMNPDRNWFVAYQFIHHFRIQCMAIGGMGAWLVLNAKPSLLRVIYARWLQCAVLAVLVAVHLLSRDFFGPLHTEVMAILQSFVIVNAATNPANVLRLENPVLNYLGRISFGIYIYQILAIRVSFLLLQHTVGFESGSWGVALLFLLGFGVTVGMAAASYHWFEKPFLKLKLRFAP